MKPAAPRYKKVKKCMAWDYALLQRYARKKGAVFVNLGWKGTAIGIEPTVTNDRIVFAEKRGLETRRRVQSQYLIPDDRKRAFDFVISSLKTIES